MDVDGDVDSQLLQQFSSMATTDREVLIAEFQRLLGNQLSDAGCAFFLDMNNWQVIVERVTSELVTRWTRHREFSVTSSLSFFSRLWWVHRHVFFARDEFTVTSLLRSLNAFIVRQKLKRGKQNVSICLYTVSQKTWTVFHNYDEVYSSHRQKRKTTKKE